jgi:hypothetical protein
VTSPQTKVARPAFEVSPKPYYRFGMPLPYSSENFAFHVDRARAQVNTSTTQSPADKAATLASAQVHATLALAIATWLKDATQR